MKIMQVDMYLAQVDTCSLCNETVDVNAVFIRKANMPETFTYQEVIICKNTDKGR